MYDHDWHKFRPEFDDHADRFDAIPHIARLCRIGGKESMKMTWNLRKWYLEEMHMRENLTIKQRIARGDFLAPVEILDKGLRNPLSHFCPYLYERRKRRHLTTSRKEVFLSWLD